MKIGHTSPLSDDELAEIREVNRRHSEEAGKLVKKHDDEMCDIYRKIRKRHGFTKNHLLTIRENCLVLLAEHAEK